MIGRSRMIADGDERDDRARAAAEIVCAQGERVTRILRQLLDFARQPPVERKPVEIAAIAEKTVDLLAPTAARRGVRLELESTSPAASAVVDATQIEQVLLNIVGNGIQATETGGQVAVDIGRASLAPPAGVAAAPGDYVSIRIRDEGHGIAPENVSHVFDPFFTTKPVGQGTGLGLSVAYGIVREHGGWIDVDSAVERGSRFTVNLPATEAAT
jgi:signal transduction histidine kinase